MTAEINDRENKSHRKLTKSNVSFWQTFPQTDLQIQQDPNQSPRKLISRN